MGKISFLLVPTPKPIEQVLLLMHFILFYLNFYLFFSFFEFNVFFFFEKEFNVIDYMISVLICYNYRSPT